MDFLLDTSYIESTLWICKELDIYKFLLYICIFIIVLRTKSTESETEILRTVGPTIILSGPCKQIFHLKVLNEYIKDLDLEPRQ